VKAVFAPFLIFLAALAMRVGFAWDYIHHFPKQALSTIPFLFESGNIAHSLATGGGFGSPFHVITGPTAWMTPLYPMLLAGIMRLFGPYTFGSYIAAITFNILVLHSPACLCISRLQESAAFVWPRSPPRFGPSPQRHSAYVSKSLDTSLSAFLELHCSGPHSRSPNRNESQPGSAMDCFGASR